MNNLLLLPALAMLIEGKALPTGCDIVNWSPPMKGLMMLRWRCATDITQLLNLENGH